MTSIVNYNEPITQPNFSNILYPLVFVGFVTFVLWKINYECKKTIKHMDNKLSALDTKWVSRMETMVGNTFDSMGNKLAKLEAENAQLKMIVYETVAKQNEEITLTKYQSEKYIDTMFVSLDSELTNKLEDLTTHVILIDKENKTLEDKLVLFGCQVNQQIEKCEKEIAYAKNNYTNMLDNMELFCERMYTTENQVSNNSHTLSELTDQIQEQMSLIKSCNKDALYNIELLNDKLSALTIGYDETLKELVHTMDTLHHSHISLKTEFEEREHVVYCGHSYDGDIFTSSRTPNIQFINANNRGFMFDAKSLKYLKNIKNIELQTIYIHAKTVYFDNISNIGLSHYGVSGSMSVNFLNALLQRSKSILSN